MSYELQVSSCKIYCGFTIACIHNSHNLHDFMDSSAYPRDTHIVEPI